MTNVRKWTADRLVRLAYRLDPNRPAARTAPGGGWLVTIGDTPVAHVSAGQVRVRVEDGRRWTR